ncbi:hypothetical protein [Parvularcula oceani]|uniref:hypothetical protein n=1 Tax=Parvularcula oceani TaxID=1247963 RepID=UPI0012DDBA90|nr:hypothetical protein [Parvularcula oceani]
MLIATSALALLAVVLAAAIQGSVRASASVASTLEGRDEIRTTERVLRDLVGRAVWTGVSEERFGFAGEPRSLSFVSLARDGELDRVELEGNAGLRLQVTSLTDGEDLIFADALAPNLQRVRFTYWGQKGGQAPRWHGVWNGNRPPRLVQMEARRGDGRNLRFHLFIDSEMPMICAFDPVSRSCRNATE